MATFQRRGEKWRAIVRKAGAKPVARTFPTKAAAREWAVQVEHEISTGRYRRPARGRLCDVIDRYLAETAELRPIGRTKRSAIEGLRNALGDLPLRALDTQALIRFALDRRRAGAGPVTIGIDLSYLGTILRSARALWGIEADTEAVADARVALRRMGLVDRARERDRRPTKDELEALFAFWQRRPPREVPMADIVKVAITTAMRCEEITRVAWRDCDLERRLLTIRDRKHPREKRGNDSTIPLLSAREMGFDAAEIIARQPRRAGRIFPVKAATVSTAFTRACAECGIEDLNFHDLRHEAASRLFEAEYRIEQVALVTGHKDWRQLRRYVQLRPEDLLRPVPAPASGAPGGGGGAAPRGSGAVVVALRPERRAEFIGSKREQS
jgi:integrase